MAFFPFQYRCPTCREEVVEKAYACPECGPEGELVYKRTGAGAFSTLRCACGHEKTKLIPPSICPKCKQPGCAWWDEANSNWASLKQSAPSTQGGVWVTGKFDGDYLALKKLTQNAAELSPNVYGLRFVRTLLKDIRQVDGPPKDLSGSAKSPITFERLHPVDVAISTVKGSQINRVTLLDFRLHDWKLLGSVLNETGDARIGRVSGEAYGILAPQEPNADKLDTAEELAQKQDSSTPHHQFSNTSSNAQGAAVETPNNEAASYNATLNEPSTTNTSRLIPDPQQAQPIQPAQLAPKVEYTSCWTCQGLPILLSFILVWIMCSFKTGIEFGLFSFAVCVFDDVVWQKGWKLVRQWQQQLMTLALLAITGAILYFVYLPKEASDCHMVPTQALAAMAAVVVISLLVPWCWIRTLFLAVLIFLVANWCSNNNASCKVQKPHEVSASPFHRLVTQARDRITDIFHSNINSEIVTSEIANEDIHRISIDEAVRKPNKLKDCRNRVYIPFDFDKSEIDAPTQYKLNRLAQSLQKLDPQKIVISGYSSFDQGDDTPEGNLRNIQLSTTRASTVSNFLFSNSQIPDRIFESRGFGSTEFISRGEGAAGINRRVEVSLPCEKATP